MKYEDFKFVLFNSTGYKSFVYWADAYTTTRREGGQLYNVYGIMVMEVG